MKHADSDFFDTSPSDCCNETNRSLWLFWTKEKKNIPVADAAGEI